MCIFHATADVVFPYRLSDTFGSDLHFELRNLRLLHATHYPNLTKHTRVLANIAAASKMNVVRQVVLY